MAIVKPTSNVLTNCFGEVKNINPGAYQGELTCPFVLIVDGKQVDCGSKAIRYVEHVSQYRLRYRCRKCGQTFQYDISSRSDLNPYVPYRKGKIWSAIEKAFDDVKRMKTQPGRKY